MNQNTEIEPRRDLAIDRFRGALVVLMVTGDYIAGISWIPAFLKHAPDIGFTIADTVAPAFVFIIGLNFGPSFRRRVQASKSAGYRYFLQRYLSLIGLGAIFTAGAQLADRTTGWGVLESLGVAGIITMMFISLSPYIRLGLGILILCVYQYVLDTAMLQAVLTTGHGGLFGAVSWSALLLLSTAIADIWRKGKTAQLVSVVSVAAVAIVSAFVIPVSKNRVSMSYILISLALTAIVFLIVRALAHKTSQQEGVFSWWGKHALALYVVHLLVLSMFGLPPITWWYAEAPVWLMIIQLAAILGFMSLVARRLEKK